MTGVEIVGDVLAANTTFTAAVPAGQMDYWQLADGTPEPSVVLTSISRTEMLFLAPERYNLVTERVQATVRARAGATRAAVIKAIRDACRNQRPTRQDVGGVVILLAGDGPDFMADAPLLFMGSTDLRVSFAEPA